MENRYKVIKNLGRQFLVLIQLGIIPTQILDYKTIYENYLELLKFNSSSESKKILSKNFDISYRQLSRIVLYMEETL